MPAPLNWPRASPSRAAWSPSPGTVHSDGEGGEGVSHASVVAFTTHEGVAVTALCTQGIRDIAKSLGRDIPLRHAPADPSLLTADPDHERA
ncbi:hypothetical protein PV367_00505 [Streptomyces europaeiscabiei]|uniref:Uncharacterized protein n=1 Tax=Streptomyces europaeiscabiei TaxID=146819 RepID=A0AAJ2UJ79_9ACTN|nr:hypothetical protein [Streptomyces europaeiscabiei]MDX3128321.1 hypothetical protein [Streptomyces europaeiscabiei]